MKTTTLRGLIVLLFCLVSNASMYAQACNAPIDATVGTSTATCRSNGSLTVTGITGNASGTPQYSLYNQANTAEIRGWQDNKVFSDLEPGTYTVRIRYACSNGFSNYLSKTAIVSGNYVDPSIQSITVDRRSQCDNGQITVQATSGRAPYTYALVPSQTATEPVANYVRPVQASKTFTGLEPGTYYVRVYDACNSYVTRSVTVNKFTATNPIALLNLNYKPCSDFNGSVLLSDLNDFLPGDARSMTITFPDGSTTTQPLTGLHSYSFSFSKEKFGALDNAKSFPDNVQNWPANFNVQITDECGNVYTRSFSIAKPDLSNTISVAGSAAGQSICDSSYVNVSPTTGNSSISMQFPTDGEIKVGNGPWKPWTANTPIAVKYGQSTTICTRVCGREVCTNYSAVSPVISSILYEYNRYSCAGNSGIAFRSYSTPQSNFFPMTVKLVSGPAGVSIPDFTYTNTINGQAFPAATANLPTGTYTFSITDACGRSTNKTITLTRPLATIAAAFSYPCGSTNLNLTFSNTEFYNIISPATEQVIYYQLFDAAGTTPVSAAKSTSGSNPVGVISDNVANGNYVIKIWRNGGESCKIDIPWTKEPNLIKLSNLMFNKNCPGTPTTNTITASASYGTEPYRYSLYQGSYAPGNLLVPAQASSLFENVQGTGPFVVFVEDACGRGTQGTVSTDVASLRVNNNAGGFMPCPGSSLTLSLLELDNATYQWYKDDVAIAGATENSFTINGMTIADAGNYSVEMKLGTCPILYNAYHLDPDKCGEMPVKLSQFGVEEQSLEGKTVVKVSWETALETSNAGFEVMRSLDAKSWATIRKVESKSNNGESASTLKYTVIDENPLNGKGYYKLKQLDFDGKFEFSPVETVFVRKDASVMLSPNPVQASFTISSRESNLKTVRIVDMRGVEVLSRDLKSNERSVDVSKLATGIYVVLFTNGNGETFSKTMIKE